jgi:ferredoxin-NADP reductase/MOSC domain-containing protein YiiM
VVFASGDLSRLAASRRRERAIVRKNVMAVLLSVNVGRAKDIQWKGRTIHTGIWKSPVMDRRHVHRLNIDGDEQGDKVGHGGEQRAVMVYQIESYRYWQRQMGRSDFVFGQFGENLTVSSLPDTEVCIGDRYRIGSALFEVTQPRVTCYRVGIRLGEPRMAALLVAHRRPGFYMRVLEEGDIGAGDAITKVADGPERMSVTEADGLVYLPHPDPAAVQRALRIEAFAPGWKIAFKTLAEQMSGIGWAEGKGLIRNAGDSAAWAGFAPMRVQAVRRRTDTIIELELQGEDAAARAHPQAGQFITLRIPGNAGAAPALRSYSLVSTATAGRYPIAVKCEPGGAGGNYLRGVKIGDVLQVAAPRGGFMLRAGPQPVVFLSAGIGVTPVLAMLRARVAQADAGPRPVVWIHGARNGAQDAFAAEARALLDQLPGSKHVIAYSRPLPADREGRDFDVRGRLDLAKLRAVGLPTDADVYLCGPDAFMRDMRAALAALSIPALHIRTERFTPATEALTPGIVDLPQRAPHIPDGAAGSGPRITFARSGISARWDSRYHSLLELAEACDVNVRWACRTGVCHTCINRTLRGTVEYDPEPLERPSAGNALICCSHPVGEVDLDM